MFFERTSIDHHRAAGSNTVTDAKPIVAATTYTLRISVEANAANGASQKMNCVENSGLINMMPRTARPTINVRSRNDDSCLATAYTAIPNRTIPGMALTKTAMSGTAT